MTSIDDQILIGTRAWLIEATGLPGGQVIPADDSGTRPPLPYLTIQIITSDVPDAWEEKTHSTNATTGDLDEQIVGYRTGSVQVDGYGRGAIDYLTTARLKLRATPVRNILREHNLSTRKEGGIQDISQLVDDEIEKRYTCDFALSYAVTLKDAIENAVTPMDDFEGGFDFSGHEFDVVVSTEE